MEILFLAVFVAVPVGIYLWRESAQKNPAVVWPGLAEDLKLGFVGSPPRMGGEWKGRKVLATSVDDGAVITLGLQCSGNIHVQVGPKQEVERESGVVVPDRASFGDTAFEQRYLARATPSELAEAAFDPAMRQKLLQMPDIRLLALRDRLELRTPLIVDTSELRQYLDIAVSIADAVDGY